MTRLSLVAFFIMTMQVAIVAASEAAKPTAEKFVNCEADEARRKLRSEELQRIVAEDQADRKPASGSIDWNVVAARDEARRKRVGEIFGEGCFSEARDFLAAALVFQHGNVPEHFFQTYLWAQKARELGGGKQARSLAAMGIDRYLINTGRRQIFGTQFSMTAGRCLCLEEVEETFPENLRVEEGNMPLEMALSFQSSSNKDKPACAAVRYCPRKLKPTPKGTLPGLW
jgi:hypothetical protein